VNTFWQPTFQRLKHRLRQSKSERRKQHIATAETPVKRAIEWLLANENPDGGIFLSSALTVSYPEVTGYLIPTLLSYGEEELATRFARWLIHIQRKDGSFASADGFPHVFDTGQALRGILATSELMPESAESGIRSAKYLHSKMIDGGRGGFDIDPVWVQRYSKSIPMSSHLYVLPPLIQGAEMFHKPEWRSAAESSLDYYAKSTDSLQLTTLTHFLAYELEALIDMGHSEAAIPVLSRLREGQAQDGSVRGKQGVSWVCTPGLAQLAVCWYKIGQPDPADLALGWLEDRQTPSGGFRGSYGVDASYFPDVEIPWAAKFYLDAALLRDRQREDSSSPGTY
jgi:malonyl-CoA O-methyltransferase